MNNFAFHKTLERKLRQIIFTDLIHDRFGKLYKIHLESMLAWLRLLASEMQLPAVDQKILLTAAYGYHWGCGNLFDLDHAHQEQPLKHNTKCFQLAASKLERFLSYHFSKLFSQQELLKVAGILEDQSHSDKTDQLTSLLRETSVLAWFELYLDKDLSVLGKRETKILEKFNKSYFLDQKQYFSNQASKQALASLID